MSEDRLKAFVNLGHRMQADIDAILPPPAADSHASWSIDMHLRVALDEIEQAIGKHTELPSFRAEELERIAHRLRNAIELLT